MKNCSVEKREEKHSLVLNRKHVFLKEKVSSSELVTENEKDLIHFFIRMWMDFRKFETATFEDFLDYISDSKKIEERLKKIPLFIQVMEIMKRVFEKQNLIKEAEKFQSAIKIRNQR